MKKIYMKYLTDDNTLSNALFWEQEVIDPMMFDYWARAADGGPTMNQH